MTPNTGSATAVDCQGCDLKPEATYRNAPWECGTCGRLFEVSWMATGDLCWWTEVRGPTL